MQKQEIRAQLRSQEPEDCDPGRGYREMSHVCDNSEVCDRQVPLTSYTVYNIKCSSHSSV